MLILRRKLWEKKGGQSVIKWEHKVSFQCHLNFLTIAREIMQIHIYKHTQGGFLIDISNNSFDACRINLVHVTFVRSPPKFLLQTESKLILKTTKLIQLTHLQNSIIASNSIFACQVFLRFCQLTKVWSVVWFWQVWQQATCSLPPFCLLWLCHSTSSLDSNSV